MMTGEAELKVWRQAVGRGVQNLHTVRERFRAESEALEAATDKVRVLGESLALVQDVAQQIQNQVHKQISSVVSRCLEAVFDEPYEFMIHFDQKRGRTEARLTFSRDGIEIDPITSSGGGVIDVAAFALRLSCLMLSRPARRKLLVLDEPFKFVSEEYRGRIQQLLLSLASEMGCQIIMVTHIKELEIGKVVRLEG
jgi:DNA repair exonuclease SbcCD ATPase subunit